MTSEIPRSIYHYTSLKTLWSILSKINDEKMTLHLHSIINMNDHTEGTTGTKVLIKALKNLKDDKYSQIITNLQQDNLEEFNNIFITSFSANHDDLNLWRSYGCDGYGVCIELDGEYLKDFSSNIPKCPKSNCSMRFHKVDYLERTQDNPECLNVLLSKLEGRDIQELEDYLKGARAFLKNKYFDSENEYRFMINHAFYTDKTKLKYELKYKYYNEAIVPYIELKLSLMAIKRITLGPSKACMQSEQTLKSYINTLSNSKNVEEPNILQDKNNEVFSIVVDRSKIPYVPK